MVKLNEVKSVAILGDIHSCKTNLAVYMLRKYKEEGGKRQIYLVGYPKQIDDFKTITFFNDLFKLTDSIIFIDELQRYINIYDRRRVQEFIELLSFFAHNNNTLIFTTCLSQFIPKKLEPYIDCWDMTRIIDVKGLKNGSKPKRIIENTTHAQCTQWSLALKNGQYLEHSELNDTEENGIKTFEDQKIEKDWRVKPSEVDISEQTESFIKEKRPEKVTENPPLNCLSKKTSERKLQKKVQKKVQKEPKVPQETDGLKSFTEDIDDKELERLAWGGGVKK